MDELRAGLAETRAQTDACLDAERASSDTAASTTKPQALRVFDDLIERDRLLADQRLLKFRDRADDRRASRRAAAPPPDHCMDAERIVADASIKAEREVADALLEGERRHTDLAVAGERRQQEAQRVRLETRRHDTDDQLSTERRDADIAVRSLGDTRNALAVVESEKARRGDVFAMVTHDLRSPLSVISMNAQVILEDTQEDSTRVAAQDVVLAAARMERLLCDLLDLARIDEGSLRMVKAPHPLGTLVSEIHQWYAPLFTDRGLTLRICLPDDTLVAFFDHDRVVQVLSNLLGNAMKFIPRGGLVELHVERRPDQVELVLRDNGPGIHPDDVPHVFKPFWQVDRDTRRGLGLGLFICKNIIEANGGQLWAESELGKGATFHFTLPISGP